MLYLTEEGEIKITDEGMQLPTVRELWNSDKRSMSKPFFFKCMTYIYWMYKKDGEYRNHPYKKRRELAEQHAKDSWKIFEENTRVKAVVNTYLENQLTLTERLYENIKRDIADCIEHLASIPIKRKIKETIEIDDVDNQGNNIKRKIKIDLEIDNSIEKSKALDLAEKLVEKEESLRKKIVKDQQSTRQGRLFDGRENNK